MSQEKCRVCIEKIAQTTRMAGNSLPEVVVQIVEELMEALIRVEATVETRGKGNMGYPKGSREPCQCLA